MPEGYTYDFAIPALTVTPTGALLSFCQAVLVSPPKLAGTTTGAATGATGATAGGEQGNVGDGRGAWTDIALRRSTDGGTTWGALQVICRNST